MRWEKEDDVVNHVTTYLCSILQVLILVLIVDLELSNSGFEQLFPTLSIQGRHQGNKQ